MRILFIGTLLLTIAGVSCGDSSNKAPTKPAAATATPKATTPPPKPAAKALTEIDPKIDIGVGPIKEVKLTAIDAESAAAGKLVFKAKCSACHKIKKRYIGPALKGITTRQRPEWIMNMILGPERMIKENFMANKLLKEFNAPMANQHVSKENARKILEYFRSNDAAKK